jgi:DNA-directed RNA polymerase subunit M/transcription elongation factor TFIIS
MRSDNVTTPGPARYIIVTRPRCPTCGSPNLHPYKSRTERDSGIATRYVRCRQCEYRFSLIVK